MDVLLFSPVGDGALMLELGDRIDERTFARVQAATDALAAARLPGVSELVPAYASVTLFYDPAAVVAAGAPEADVPGWLGERARAVLSKLPGGARPVSGRVVEIPLVYGGEYGPDLSEVAERTALSEEDVVRLHSGADYLVYLLGFSPGFSYMGGLAPELSVPRRAVPRPAVAPGSVGIINDQTCIYPQATPGGWNLIGRTPLVLFSPQRDPPVRLRPGDRVRFRPIAAEEFQALEAAPWE